MINKYHSSTFIQIIKYWVSSTNKQLAKDLLGNFPDKKAHYYFRRNLIFSEKLNDNNNKCSKNSTGNYFNQYRNYQSKIRSF